MLRFVRIGGAAAAVMVLAVGWATVRVRSSERAATDADAVVAAFAHEDGDVNVPVDAKPMTVERVEWEHIQHVLHHHGGNVSATARALSMHRRTLQRKLLRPPDGD
jgi:ActR/RegA family two-component response regulator